MVLVSYSGKEINAKLVYYGPGLSGKTTNLEQIYGSIPQTHRGKMVSMKTKTERTLFFDFLPVNLGELAGFKTRFLLYTVPGQVYYNATRKLVLKGVDAVVFVADSKRGKMDENVESLENLKENLRENGLTLDTLPWVLQYNKRDLPDAYSIEELEQVLNPHRVPYFEAVATNGQGVVETFKAVSKLLLRKLSKEVGAPILSNKTGSEEGGAQGVRTSGLMATPPQAAPAAPAQPPMPTSPPATVPSTFELSGAAPTFAGPPTPSSSPEIERRPSSPPAFERFDRSGETPATTTSAKSLGISRGADSFDMSPAGATTEPPVAPSAPVTPPSASSASAPSAAAGAEDAPVSVGDRLRRWLGRKDSSVGETQPSMPTFAMPVVTPPAASSPAAPPAPVTPVGAGDAHSVAPAMTPESTSSPSILTPAEPPVRGPIVTRAFELDAGIGADTPVAAMPTAAAGVSEAPHQPSTPAAATTPDQPQSTPSMLPAAPEVHFQFGGAPVEATHDKTTDAPAEREPRTIVVPIEIDPEEVASGVVLKLELRVAPRQTGDWKRGRAA